MNDTADEINKKIKRKRWRNVFAVYIILLLFSMLFIGPFLFGMISSLKDNPTEWPPSLSAEQLKLTNWVGAYNLAKQVGNSGFFGKFKSGEKLSMNVSYLFPENIEIQFPEVNIPKNIAGSGRGALEIDQKFATNYIEIGEINEINRKTTEDGTIVKFQIIVSNPSEYDFDKVPLNIKVPYKVKYIKSPLEPNREERLGMVQSWNNISAGVMPYIFHNYSRVFNENYSRTTGRSLFLTWIINSFIISIAKVITTILFASMAGYALARLKFKGKKFIFFLVLFSMMIPIQVTFISNYLVLKDGIFGLTKLFGINTLLNTFTGLVVSSMVAGSSVFIMKQFFEGLPKSLEESARIDGASTYVIFFKIMLPLAKPALGALTVLTFQGAWNDFFRPLVYITSPMDKFPLTVGLLSFKQTYGAGGFDWGPILSGAIISAIPIIILFVVFQQYFVEGISFSGMKG
ncbi:MAG: carbohydrate ABC transporter permease [Halanaerobiales bacterium]|nr:carbohydrate ABC transporter permease [Halanaerobiales bacterium]